MFGLVVDTVSSLFVVSVTGLLVVVGFENQVVGDDQVHQVVGRLVVVNGIEVVTGRLVVV